MEKFPRLEGFNQILTHFYAHIRTNQVQLKVIFFLILAIAVMGLIIICIPGLGLFTNNPGNVNIISLISGGALEVISALALVVYRLSMRQAQSFMLMIERINAVIMSVHILETIEEDQKMKNEYAAKLAERLLYFYKYGEDGKG